MHKFWNFASALRFSPSSLCTTMLDLFKNIVRRQREPQTPPASAAGVDTSLELSRVRELLEKRPEWAPYYTEMPHRYLLEEKLGEGAFSVVYRATDTRAKDPKDRTLAIKIISKENVAPDRMESIRREIAIMRRLDHHQNIIRLYNYQNDEGSKYCFLFMELASGGEIFNPIIKYTYFSEDLTRHIMRQVASTIKFLHDRGIVHRDIKPENILFEPIEFVERSHEEQVSARRKSDDANKIDEGKFIKGKGSGGIGRIKLADFGLAIDLGESGSNMAKTPCGTVGYTSPEQHLNLGYDKKVDLWSLGCVLYTMVVGFPPFYSNTQNKNDISHKVAKGQYTFLKPWFDEVSIECKNLISNLLTVDPIKRYSIEQLLDDPWMNIGYEDDMHSSKPADDIPQSHFDPALYAKFQETLNTGNIDDYFSGNKLSFQDPAAAVTPRAEAIKLVFNTATDASRCKTPLLSATATNSGVYDKLCLTSLNKPKSNFSSSISDLSDYDEEDDEEEEEGEEENNHHNSQHDPIEGVFTQSDLESEDSELENSNDLDEDDLDEETQKFIQSMGQLKKFNSPRLFRKESGKVNVKSSLIESTTASRITPVHSHATATTVTTVMTVGSNGNNDSSYTNDTTNKSVQSKSSKSSLNHHPSQQQKDTYSSIDSTLSSTLPPHTHSSILTTTVSNSTNSTTTNSILTSATTATNKSSVHLASAFPSSASHSSDSTSSSIVTCEIQEPETGRRRKSSIVFQLNSPVHKSSETSLSIPSEDEEELSPLREKRRDSDDSEILDNGGNTEDINVVGLEEDDDTEVDIETPKVQLDNLSFTPTHVSHKDMRKAALAHTPFVAHQRPPMDSIDSSIKREERDEDEDDGENNSKSMGFTTNVFDLKMDQSKLLERRKNNLKDN